MLEMMPIQHLQARLRLQQNIACCKALLLLRKKRMHVAQSAPAHEGLKLR